MRNNWGIGRLIAGLMAAALFCVLPPVERGPLAQGASSGPPGFARVVARHAEWLGDLGDPQLLDAMGMESGFISVEALQNPRRADLKNRDLSHLKFPRLRLRASEMSGVNLSGAELPRADLSHATLTGANLSAANLENANLRQVAASLGTWRGINLSGADLTGANLTKVDLRGANLSGANLSGAMLVEADLTEANLNFAVLREADLTGAVMNRADLHNADLTGSVLRDAVLKNAVLQNTNLDGTQLFGANLDGSFVSGTRLSGASLKGASLRGINLFASNLEGTSLEGVDLFGVVFDPPPQIIERLNEELRSTSRAKNLGMMTFNVDPGPLEDLRRLFKENGYRKQELEITYAIRRGIRKRVAESGSLSERVGSALQFIFIEFPIEYGASPYRPFAVIFFLVFIFGFIYLIPLRYPSSRFGQIWKVTPLDHSKEAGGAMREELLTAGRWQNYVLVFWFSFLSAFNIGSKIFNVDDLFTHCQPTEFHLRSTQWVRTISGIQALVSVYLLVLMLLVFLEKITF